MNNMDTDFPEVAEDFPPEGVDKIEDKALQFKFESTKKRPFRPIDSNSANSDTTTKGNISNEYQLRAIHETLTKIVPLPATTATRPSDADDNWDEMVQEVFSEFKDEVKEINSLYPN